MNPFIWQRARRGVLLVACVAYFATIAIVGQVAEGHPVPEQSAPLLDVRR